MLADFARERPPPAAPETARDEILDPLIRLRDLRCRREGAVSVEFESLRGAMTVTDVGDADSLTCGR
jgi:hypothetical protein